MSTDFSTPPAGDLGAAVSGRSASTAASRVWLCSLIFPLRRRSAPSHSFVERRVDHLLVFGGIGHVLELMLVRGVEHTRVLVKKIAGTASWRGATSLAGKVRRREFEQAVGTLPVFAVALGRVAPRRPAARARSRRRRALGDRRVRLATQRERRTGTLPHRRRARFRPSRSRAKHPPERALGALSSASRHGFSHAPTRLIRRESRIRGLVMLFAEKRRSAIAGSFSSWAASCTVGRVAARARSRRRNRAGSVLPRSHPGRSSSLGASGNARGSPPSRSAVLCVSWAATRRRVRGCVRRAVGQTRGGRAVLRRATAACAHHRDVIAGARREPLARAACGGFVISALALACARAGAPTSGHVGRHLRRGVARPLVPFSVDAPSP